MYYLLHVWIEDRKPESEKINKENTQNC